MEEEKKGSAEGTQVLKVECPNCHSSLWVDPVAKAVIKSERGKKKKGSLDELLLKEKKRRVGFDRKFEATAELEKTRLKNVLEKFEKAYTEVEKDE